MLTCLNSAPRARSAATVCAEKPHCGKSGVPFMKSTTGLEPSSALILSTTSIDNLVTAFGRIATGSKRPQKNQRRGARRQEALRHRSFAGDRPRLWLGSHELPAPFQLGDQPPLLGGAHGCPPGDLIAGAQAADAVTLLVERADPGTGGTGAVPLRRRAYVG